MIPRAWPILQIETEMRRLRTLQYLMQSPGYQAAGGLLLLHANAVGVPTTADKMQSCLCWLEEAQLITRHGTDDQPVARITNQGREVAEGLVMHPGVMRPDP